MDAAHWLVLPVLGQIVLTVVIGLLTLRARIHAGRSGQVTLKQVALDNSAWPDAARKFGNNFDNQFQVPLLFIAAVACYLATGLADAVAVVTAFVFFASRCLHTAEHVGRNMVLRRLAFFLVSVTAMVALWLWFALRFYVIG